MHNIKSWLRVYDESTWGAIPGSPEYRFLPVTSFDVRCTTEQRRATPYTGLQQRKHGRRNKKTVSGAINSPLYGFRLSPQDSSDPSLAQYLMDWAFLDRETVETASKGAIWAEGPDSANQRYTGMRVNQATLTGSDDSGGVSINIDVIGQDMDAQTDGTNPVATGDAPPDDMKKLSDFEFQDVTLQFNSSAKLIKEFTYTRSRNQTSDFFGKDTIQSLLAGEDAETFSFMQPKTDDEWDLVAASTDDQYFDAALTLKGLHEGTGAAGTWTQCVITFPCLRFVSKQDNRDRGTRAMTTIEFDVLKPDTSSNAATFTWSEN